MYIIVTRSFPPEVGGMQNLMWGLTCSLAKYNLVKVFADFHEKYKEHDKKVSFSIDRVGGIKLLRKHRKSYLVNEFIKKNKNVKKDPKFFYKRLFFHQKLVSLPQHGPCFLYKLLHKKQLHYALQHSLLLCQ